MPTNSEYRIFTQHCELVSYSHTPGPRQTLQTSGRERGQTEGHTHCERSCTECTNRPHQSMVWEAMTAVTPGRVAGASTLIWVCLVCEHLWCAAFCVGLCFYKKQSIRKKRWFPPATPRTWFFLPVKQERFSSASGDGKWAPSPLLAGFSRGCAMCGARGPKGQPVGQESRHAI